MRNGRHYIFFKSSAALVREPPELPGLGEEAIPLIFDHTIYFILLLFWGRGGGGGGGVGGWGRKAGKRGERFFLATDKASLQCKQNRCKGSVG